MVLCGLTASATLAQGQALEPGATVNPNGTINTTLELTPTQKREIYSAAAKDGSKKSPIKFQPSVGAPVPPSIELYNLPDSATAENPAAQFYRFTMVQDKVVVVDPTKMKVVEVIDNNAGH